MIIVDFYETTSSTCCLWTTDTVASPRQRHIFWGYCQSEGSLVWSHQQLRTIKSLDIKTLKKKYSLPSANSIFQGS